MTRQRDPRIENLVLTLTLGLFGLGVLLLVLRLQYFPRGLPTPPLLVTPIERVYVPTCNDPKQSNPLFQLRHSVDKENRPTLELEDVRGAVQLLALDSGRTEGKLLVERIDNSPRTVRIGRYALTLRYSSSPGGANRRHDSASQGYLSWQISGVELRVMDVVGRAPTFATTGRLEYRSDCTTPGRQGAALALWADGMPSSAFRVLPDQECGNRDGLCAEALAANGWLTIERGAEKGATEFVHLTRGEKGWVPAGGLLWIAHVPFRITEVAGERWMIVDEDYLHLRGERQALGRMLYRGEISLGPRSSVVGFYPVDQLFKGTHLQSQRWNPMQEDRYQVLIDHELLCLEIEDRIPRLVWKPVFEAGCRDPLVSELESPSANAVASVGVSKPVIELYRQTLATDRLVEMTNRQLAEGGYRTLVDDMAFSFEWWPYRWVDASGEARLDRFPRKLWGPRTLSSQYSATTLGRSREAPSGSKSSEEDLRDSANHREIRIGRTSIVARTEHGVRRYERLHGLGPLLGVRGHVDGLDNRLGETALDEISLEAGVVNLTIDPELQSALWSNLRTRMTTVKLPDTAARRPDFGVTAVALDPSDGAVLAVLNWPEGLRWEGDGSGTLPMESRIAPNESAGRSLNRAFGRVNAVGSSLKILTLYAMAEAELLNDLPEPAALPEPSILRMDHRTGALIQGNDGRVSLSSCVGYSDKQKGHLPVGVDGIPRAARMAVGNSSNAFFHFVGTKMIAADGSPFHWLDPISKCPINKDGMLDAPHSDWLLCDLAASDYKLLCPRFAERSEEYKNRPETVLVLPVSWANPEAILPGIIGDAGYYSRAINAGYRFQYLENVGTRSPLRSGRNSTEYEGRAYRQDWFPHMPFDASRPLFEYPEMWSPGSALGWFKERHGNKERVLAAGDHRNWRALAAQLVGEGGKASALSLATLYTPIARDDGLFAAPYLVVGGGVPPDTGRPAFRATRSRLKALRELLREPILRGTAMRSFNRADSRERVWGKTGTFDLEYSLRDWPDPFVANLIGGNSSSSILDDCGVAEEQAGTVAIAPGEARALGTPRCENTGFFMTAVHRYPASVTETALLEKERVAKLSSFVGIVLAAPESTGGAVVLSIVSDVEGVNATDLFVLMLGDVRTHLEGKQR